MPEVATKTVWAIDPMHSEIQFKVRHLVISTVTGSFQQFDAKVESNGDSFEGASIEFSAEIASIYTNNEQRDGHLKSADFFDAANHPQLTFRSTSFTQKADGDYELTGDLTIRGTTKPVTLAVEHGGVAVDPYGQTKAGFELSGKINRKDFGLAWSATTEAGGVVVADEVKLIMNVQFTKQ
jgi:polyisoprenoid-binding protein YceI